ncbi:hypothetical protein FRX31_029649 [Thalictrum thalictroides]|uniref:Uncharacterized protein n=1 Tax=Thalictrum thalictroides TaxID=46969 RepID=A0A7J6V999_THATH|nr:hypothetical protein FRX31_029649 [Thalictrum thalictroides]
MFLCTEDCSSFGSLPSVINSSSSNNFDRTNSLNYALGKTMVTNQTDESRQQETCNNGQATSSRLLAW